MQKITESVGQEPPLLSIVIPCHNEEDAVADLVRELRGFAETERRARFEFVLVNDGSEDSTLAKLIELTANDDRYVLVDLSRNFGKEAAISAGLFHATGEAVVVMDADLQHPIGTVSAFLSQWLAGSDVVLGKRRSREGDGSIYRALASLFYKLHNALCEPSIPSEVGDFRLMDRRVVETVLTMPEQRRFMKGIFAWVGYCAVTVEFDVARRSAGQSRFDFARLLALALEGITSFSILPLRIWSIIGGFMALASIAYGSFVFARTLFYGIDLPGYASLAIIVTFVGSLQLIGIGVIGEYIGRTYMESKRRPPFVVQDLYRNGQVISRRTRRSVS